MAVIAVVMVGCGGSAGSSSSGANALGSAQAAKAVTIEDYTYTPARNTVPRGTTISFANRDSTPHTATSRESGAFDTDSIATGKSASVTLERTGTFTYYCVFHPFMKGTIAVE